MRFVIHNAANGQYYFTIVGGNFETLATSETYYSKASCQHTINVIKRDAASASVIDLTKAA
jgi:uncharacterized protein YegP (UPF0339 family)